MESHNLAQNPVSEEVYQQETLGQAPVPALVGPILELRLSVVVRRPAPHLIVLDVMLPGIDDWELLGRLRAHPRTRAAPIIICTILPQKELALALGAAAFIRKPVSRPALLSALDHQVDAFLKAA